MSLLSGLKQSEWAEQSDHDRGQTNSHLFEPYNKSEFYRHIRTNKQWAHSSAW